MPSKRIPIESLKIGMYLCGIDRSWFDTPFLTHRFLVKNQSQIEKLRGCGVTEVDIDTNQGLDLIIDEIQEGEHSEAPVPRAENVQVSLSEPAQIQTLEQRIADLPTSVHGKSLSDELSSRRQLREQMLESVRDLLGSVRTSGVVPAREVKEVAQSIVTETLGHEDACIALIRTREFSPDLYDHSLSVGTLAVVLGRVIGFDEAQLRTLATAALLHDVGLLRLPKEILCAKDRRSGPHWDLYYSHPALGLELLKESSGIPPEVGQIVAEHHVTLDDKGFPRTISSNEISYHSRLIMVVDEYDELLTGQGDRPPLTVKDALGELYRRGERNRLDLQFVSQFINQVGIYPIYSLVELNTGERGIVTANSPENLLQPTILLIEDSNRKPFSEPVPVNFSVITPETSRPEIAKVLDPEQLGIRVEQVLANWVLL